jgi:hypothetical protein
LCALAIRKQLLLQSFVRTLACKICHFWGSVHSNFLTDRLRWQLASVKYMRQSMNSRARVQALAFSVQVLYILMHGHQWCAVTNPSSRKEEKGVPVKESYLRESSKTKGQIPNSLGIVLLWVTRALAEIPLAS